MTKPDATGTNAGSESLLNTRLKVSGKLLRDATSADLIEEARWHEARAKEAEFAARLLEASKQKEFKE